MEPKFAGHVQLMLPKASVDVDPDAHKAQVPEFTDTEYVPVGHKLHVADESVPTSLLPAGQSQTRLFPVPVSTNADVDPIIAALHVHVPEPAAEVDPRWQGVHEEAALLMSE